MRVQLPTLEEPSGSPRRPLTNGRMFVARTRAGVPGGGSALAMVSME